MPRPAQLLALCLAASAHAQADRLDLRPLGADDSVAYPGRNYTVPGLAPVRTVVDHGDGLRVHRPRAEADAPRGGPLSVGDDLENLALDPTPLHMQTGGPMWSIPSITGLNRWVATTVAGRTAFAAGGPIAGNATTTARLRATSPFPPSLFFFGARYELLRQNSPLVRLSLQPGVDQTASIEHDLYVASLDSLWTSEPVYLTAGYIASRMLWGGSNNDPNIGLPVGSLPGVYVLWSDPASFLTPIFRTCKWVGSAPAGAQVGDDVVMPAGSWVRVRHEMTPTGRMRHWLNFNDGTGFHLCHDAAFMTFLRFDSLAANGSFEAVNDPMHIDNVTFAGVEVDLAIPPAPLECGASGYTDDIGWLHVGPLLGQHEVWFDASSSRAVVVEQAGDRAIYQYNYFSDDRHREEFTRDLPTVFATPGRPWSLCESVRRGHVGPGGGFTVRAFAPASQIANSFVTRVAMGHYDPERTPVYAGRVFIQHNPAYNPYDDPNSANPYLPGPNGAGRVARIGGAATIGDPNFDYYDTGVSLAPQGVETTWCIEVAHDNSMTAMYGGAALVGGDSGVVLDAFTSSVTELRHESENQAIGHNDFLVVDDIVLNCNAHCGFSLPAFSLVHVDDLNWGVAGLSIGAHDDDCDPQTPFRWSSAPNMPIVDLGPGQTLALRMENLLRDTAQSPPHFTLFEQASTALPHVSVSPTRGYAASAEFRLTDGATTRAWFVGEASAQEGQYRLNAGLLYSSDTGTLWVIQPDAADPVSSAPVWIDTGRSLGDFGIAFNQWFKLSIHRNLDGTFIFRINALVLTDEQGQVVRAAPLQSAEGGVHEDLDRLFFLSGDEVSAPAGSILFADNIRAWALPCLGDTNDDGVVNFADINNILGQFNATVAPTMSPNVAPDADGDGVADDHVVNFADLNAALGQFNNPCD